MRNGEKVGFQRSREEIFFSLHVVLPGWPFGGKKKKNGKIMPLPHALHKINYKGFNIILFKNS